MLVAFVQNSEEVIEMWFKGMIVGVHMYWKVMDVGEIEYYIIMGSVPGITLMIGIFSFF